MSAASILFDLDGTLTDPREGITKCLAHALERMGVEPPPLDELTFAIGPPLRASLASLLGTGSREAVERALAFYRERFADVGLYENAPYEGIDAALVALREAGFPLFVALGSPDGRGAGPRDSQKIASGCAGAPVEPTSRIGVAVKRNS